MSDCGDDLPVFPIDGVAHCSCDGEEFFVRISPLAFEIESGTRSLDKASISRRASPQAQQAPLTESEKQSTIRRTGRIRHLRDIVDEYIRSTLETLAPPSPSGLMLEAASIAKDNRLLGVWMKPPEDDGKIWRVSMGQERRLERRAKVVWVVAALGSGLEREAVIRMRLWLPPSEWNEQQSSYYERISASLTRSDEEFVRASMPPEWDTAVQARNALAGESYHDAIVVGGHKLVYPTREQVAAKMKLLRPSGEPDVRRLSSLLEEGYDRMCRRVAFDQEP
jgi:hypothetical protein